jgi:uncharacterized membrane protein YsdA (DUF1294 family)/cold shock CspA family protein
MMQGIVVKYDKEKGYGFIRTSELEDDLFVHISEVQNSKVLTEGQRVEFKVEQKPKGPTATSVIAGRVSYSPSLIYGSVALVTILVVILLMHPYHILLSYLVAINITTFLLYGYDKYIASTEKVRVPEKTLHLLAVLGGSPAGLIAQRFFRHKTLKESFQIIYWVIVLIQIALLYTIL